MDVATCAAIIEAAMNGSKSKSSEGAANSNSLAIAQAVADMLSAEVLQVQTTGTAVAQTGTATFQ